MVEKLHLSSSSKIVAFLMHTVYLLATLNSQVSMGNVDQWGIALKYVATGTYFLSRKNELKEVNSTFSKCVCFQWFNQRRMIELVLTSNYIALHCMKHWETSCRSCMLVVSVKGCKGWGRNCCAFVAQDSRCIGDVNICYNNKSEIGPTQSPTSTKFT